MRDKNDDLIMILAQSKTMSVVEVEKLLKIEELFFDPEIFYGGMFARSMEELFQPTENRAERRKKSEKWANSRYKRKRNNDRRYF